MTWVDRHSDSRWIFRGLGDVSFALLPSAGRVSRYSETQERTILEIFDRRASEFVDAERLTEWDKLALAQHHGLPTRLLDWTTNPLVGAYFAVISQPGSETFNRSRAGGSASSKAVRATPEALQISARVVAWRVTSRTVIDPRNELDPFALSETRFLLPRALTTRIVTQSGLFSVHPNPPAAWLEPLEDKAQIFDIPGDLRSFFRRKLFYLGVDAQRVMGGLDGLCDRLRWQYNTGIGLGAVR